MNTKNNLLRLKLLLEAVSVELGKVARLFDDRRMPVINIAIADLQRARCFWKDEKVVGMDKALSALVEATERLLSAMRVKSPQERAQLSNIAHQRVASAIGEIEATLAECQEEVPHVGD